MNFSDLNVIKEK